MAEKEPPKDPPDLKVVQGGARRRGHVTLQMYTSLREMYLLKGVRTVRGLSRESGVSMDTCQKAIVHGWPDRGWPPLRELAAQHDAAQAKAAAAKGDPSAETIVVEAMQFKRIRHENLEMAIALRALIRQMMRMVFNELPNATLYRQGVQVRVIEEVRGKKVVQRVVRENVRLPPYLPHMMSAIGEAMSAAKIAGDHERVWARFVPPEGEGNVGWDSLTDEQLDEISKNEGKLPEGWTIESLRRRS